MAHIRKTIREHVVTTITSLSTTGSNVYETRYFPLQTGNLPALIVYTLDETVEDYTLGRNTRTQQRSLNLIIEAHCRGTANIDDTLDTIAEEGVPPELIEGKSLLKKNKTIVTDINTLKENNLTIIGTCQGLNMN